MHVPQAQPSWPHVQTLQTLQLTQTLAVQIQVMPGQRPIQRLKAKHSTAAKRVDLPQGHL